MITAVNGASSSVSNSTQRAATPKWLVVALRTGRLSNRLILYANIIAMAEEQGHRVINFAFHSYAHLFDSTRRDIYCRYPASEKTSLIDLAPGVSNVIRRTRIFYHATRYGCLTAQRLGLLGQTAMCLPETGLPDITLLDDAELQRQIAPARVLFVYGWPFRAPNWVQKHADKIRAHFRPIAEIEDGSRRLVESLRARADAVVGVHVRHGDYRTYEKGRYLFDVAAYHEWMRQLAAQLAPKKVAFLVCSDEPRSPGEFPGLAVQFGSPSPLVDVFALSKCDYILGPPSTFSQWASFYGNTPLLHVRAANKPIGIDQFAVDFLLAVPGYPREKGCPSREGLDLIPR